LRKNTAVQQIEQSSYSARHWVLKNPILTNWNRGVSKNSKIFPKTHSVHSKKRMIVLIIKLIAHLAAAATDVAVHK